MRSAGCDAAGLAVVVVVVVSVVVVMLGPVAGGVPAPGEPVESIDGPDVAGVTDAGCRTEVVVVDAASACTLLGPPSLWPPP